MMKKETTYLDNLGILIAMYSRETDKETRGKLITSFANKFGMTKREVASDMAGALLFDENPDYVFIGESK